MAKRAKGAGWWRRSRGLALAGWVASSAGCIANVPVEAPTAEVGEYPTSEFELASGMRVVLERAPDVGVATVVLMVGAGSTDEPAGKAGVAHLAEHLVFETRGDGELPLKKRLAARAAAWNGSTGWDATTYTADVPAPSLEQALDLVGEALRRPLAGVNDADFARQLDIVQNERRLRSENGAHSEALGWLAEAVFPDSFAYAHPVAGTQASLDGLTLADVQSFVRSGYHPDRATLAVSSALDFGAQLALVQHSFGPLAREAKRGELPRAMRTRGGSPPLRASAPASVHDSLVANPTVLIGWSVPSTLAERGSAPELLARMARGTLFYDSELRDVVDGFASYLDGVQGGLFVVRVTLESLPEDAPSTQDLVRRVASRVRRGLYQLTVSSDLFERYKRLVAVGETYALEHPAARAASLASSKHYLSSAKVLGARDRQLRALTQDDVKAYVEAHLSDERARAVVLRPRRAEPARTERPRATPPVSASTARTPLVLPPLAPGELQGWVHGLEARELGSGTLSNGMSVIVANRPASVYHTVLVGFAGGSTAEGVPGVTIAEPWSLQRTHLEPSAQGLDVARYHDIDSSVEAMRSTGSRLDISLDALREWLDDVNIAWPPRQFLDRLNNYSREDAQPDRQLASELGGALFGRPFATSEQVGAVQPNDIYSFREKTLRPENGVLVIVGNIAPERGLVLAEQLMGGWSKAGERAPRVPSPRLVTAGAPPHRARLAGEHPRPDGAELPARRDDPRARHRRRGARRAHPPAALR